MQKKIIHGLYAIFDPRFSVEQDPVKVCRAILKGGGKILQLRIKAGYTVHEISTIAKAIVALKQEFEFTFIVNDYFDLALEVGADGVHMGVDDGSISQVRQKIGHEKIMGYSSHRLEEALQAHKLGADYVAMGAVYPTVTKGLGHPVCGLEILKTLVQQLSVPLVAIGGINQKNLPAVLATGVAAVAMITEILGAKDIEARVRELINVIARYEKK